MELLIHALPIGVGATLLMDLWGAVRQPLFGFARLDYALLGRWVGGMAAGQFRHDAIARSAPVRRERLIGWTAHYLIGVSFAALLLAIWGAAWLHRPALGPALLVGIGTTAAPLLIMQPAMGAGVAASRTPRPNAARLQSLLTHAIYGLGLYLAGWLDHALLAS
ncbi:MAG: DUF2938 domain-containing protein [Gemmatimonadales bacterium]